MAPGRERTVDIVKRDPWFSIALWACTILALLALYHGCKAYGELPGDKFYLPSGEDPWMSATRDTVFADVNLKEWRRLFDRVQRLETMVDSLRQCSCIRFTPLEGVNDTVIEVLHTDILTTDPYATYDSLSKVMGNFVDKWADSVAVYRKRDGGTINAIHQAWLDSMWEEHP